MNNIDIDRINELYHKSKSVGLTKAEEAEQKKQSALKKLLQKKRYQKQYQAARQSKKVKDAAITSAQKFTEKAKENLLAMLEQAKFSAADNTDAQALRVPSLYPEWEALEAGTHLTKGRRCTYNKVLYNVLSDHDKQEQWTPEAAPSLFAKVLIPDPNVTPDWEQPGSTNGYKKGDKVKHNSKVWESLVDNNVWEPGAVGTDSVWKEASE